MPKNYDNTDKVIKAMEEATKTALMAGITDMHGQAVELAPIKTGNLKGSLSWTVGGEVGGLNAPGGKPPKGNPRPATASDGVNATRETDTAYLGTNVEYAIYMEYGTSKIPGGRPFLIPAFDARKKYTPEIMAREYKKALQGVKR